MVLSLDNAQRQRFVESSVADFYTRAFCLTQLVQRALENNSNVTLTKREIARTLDLRKTEGDLAVLCGVGELLQPGFCDEFDRCPP